MSWCWRQSSEAASTLRDHDALKVVVQFEIDHSRN